MKDFITKVFGWLFIGLLTTFASAFALAMSPTLFVAVFSSYLYWVIIVAEVVVAIILSARIHKMKPLTAKILYFAYAILTGLSFSSIFIIYEMSSIIFIFLVAAILFGLFAIIGKTTKIDLSKIGIYLLMTLIGIIILEIINIFLFNNTLNIVICIVSLVVFMLYTAYDMQKITSVAVSGYGNENLAIIGAFQLYLDFINIFIKLLRLFGRRRD